MDAEDDVAEVEGDAHQGVLPAFAPRAGTAAALPPPAAPKNVSKMSLNPPKPPCAAAERLVAAHVVAGALVGVAQHVVRVGHELEALGRVLARVHVGVQLPREAPVRLLDLVGGRVARDAEDLVVVSHNRLPAAACRGSC